MSKNVKNLFVVMEDRITSISIYVTGLMCCNRKKQKCSLQKPKIN